MSADQPLAPETDALVAQAVESLSGHAIVTRYVLVAETIDPETGGRGLVTIVDDNAMAWDVLGLMGEALAKAQAEVTARTIAENLDE